MSGALLYCFLPYSLETGSGLSLNLELDWHTASPGDVLGCQTCLPPHLGFLLGCWEKKPMSELALSLTH